MHLQYLGYPIANDTQYGGPYGGPLASRVMARDLGVSWDRQRQAAAEEQQQQAAEQQQQQQGKGPDGSTAGQQGAAGSTADYNGEEGCAAKRARTDPGASQAAGVASQEQHQQAKEAAELCEDPHSQRCPAAAPSGGGSGGGERSSSGGGGPAGVDGAADQAQPEGDAYAQNQAFRSSPEYQAPAALHDPLCPHCPYYAPRDYPLDLRPLWLHARCYSCAEGEWSFSAGLPEWAARDYVPQR